MKVTERNIAAFRMSAVAGVLTLIVAGPWLAISVFALCMFLLVEVP